MAAGEIARWFVTLGVRGADKVKKGLQDVKGGLGDLGSAASLVKGALGSLGVYMTARTVYDLAGVGAQAQRLETSFQELARQAGASGDEILAALKRASGGTVAETDLMLSANRAMLLGLGADAQQLADLMEVARFRARAMGLTTTQAFSDIVTGLGRMSPLILDNLGLVFDAEAEYERYAQSIGKTAKELTEAEKKQALLNATLRVGQQQITAAGGIAEDAADAFERLGSAVTDLKTAVGTVLGELLAGPLAKLASWIKDLSQNTYVFGMIASMLGGLDDAAKAFFTGQDPAKAYAEAVNAAAYAHGILNEEIVKMPDPAKEWWDMRQAILEANREMWQGANLRRQLAKGMPYAQLYPETGEPVSPMWARILNEMWDRAKEDGIEAANQTKNAWESMIADISADLQGIMRPTFAFDFADVMDQLGHHIDTWDEEARRAMDVVNRGMESPWAKRMLEKGFITEEDIAAQGGDVRAAAAVWIKEFYQGLHPEAIQGGAVAQQWKDLVTKQENWKGIFGELAKVLGEELKTDQEKMEAAGKAVGQVVAKGVKEALGQEDFLGYIAEKVAPKVRAMITTSAGGGYVE